MPSPSDLNRQFAERIVLRLRETGQQGLFAGGCVRDLLLGKSPKDYDVATDARPEQVRNLFGRRKTLAVGESFGVIVVVPSRSDRAKGVEPVEVATFRTEGPYLDGRRPERVAFSTPEEDAQRRDFTINGMFYDPLDDRVFDYVGGRQDLDAGIIRAIGEPHARMAEDKLRMLRAIRFAATLDFRLDAATGDAVRSMARQLIVVSAERIAQELRRMLAHKHRRRAIELADECDLLEVIFPELDDRRGLTAGGADWDQTLRMLELLGEATFEAALAVLLEPVVETSGLDPIATICQRLRLSNNETEQVVWFLAHRNDLDGIRNGPPSQLKRLGAHRGALELVQIARARQLAQGCDTSELQEIERFLRETPASVLNPPPLLTGGDLIAFGLKPGPHFKLLLETARDAQLDGTISTPEEALEFARRLHESNSADTN